MAIQSSKVKFFYDPQYGVKLKVCISYSTILSIYDYIIVLKRNQVQGCKNKCKESEQISKGMVYKNGGCFCRNCDYYFKELFSRYPCCNGLTRHNTRNNKEQTQICRI